MIPTLEEKLKAVFHGDIDSRNATLGLYSHDASLFEVVPKLVVYPRNTADVQNLVRFVSDEKANDATVSLTMRSAGTDMSGGPLNDSIIADMTKYFTHIGSIGADSAIVEPGVYYRDFEKETLRKG
jgi:FAD/FMN-containing dehydrogenase